ncbi:MULTISPECIES: hypothetical protein [Streptomyces]|uniref:hypothetical protein n=1 Tax=Streptomyces TaxID=1883 RepID=UPI00368B2111
MRSAAERRDCWAVSARVHHLAATTLAKIGESDISWLAAERAMRAAGESDDPLVLASAARSGTHALLANGRYDDAMELGDTASAWLSARPGIRTGPRRRASYVVERGQVDVDHTPPERGVSHRVDYARALSMAGQGDSAFTELCTAEHASPQLVRNNPRVRDTLRDLIKQSPVTSSARSSELFMMAQRCRAVE